MIVTRGLTFLAHTRNPLVETIHIIATYVNSLHSGIMGNILEPLPSDRGFEGPEEVPSLYHRQWGSGGIAAGNPVPDAQWQLPQTLMPQAYRSQPMPPPAPAPVVVPDDGALANMFGDLEDDEDAAELVARLFDDEGGEDVDVGDGDEGNEELARLDHVVRVARRLPPPTHRSYQRAMLELTRGIPWLLSRLSELYRSTPGEFCDLRKMPKRLFPHQVLAYAHFVNVAEQIRTAGENVALQRERVPRGFIMYHSTGSGKTAVQGAIVDAVDPLLRQEGWSIYFVTTPENRDQNNLQAISQWAEMYTLGLQEACPLATSNRLGEAGVRQCKSRGGVSSFLSYTSFANALARGEVVLDKAVVVLDEVQSMLVPPKVSDMSQLGAYRRANRALQAANGRVLYVLLTATPGHDVDNTLRLLRLLEWPRHTAPRSTAEAMAPVLAHARSSSGGEGGGGVASVDLAWGTDADPETAALYTATGELSREQLTRLAPRLRNRVSYVDLRHVRGLYPRLQREDVLVPTLFDDTPSS